jgi:hypothetical protein
MIRLYPFKKKAAFIAISFGILSSLTTFGQQICSAPIVENFDNTGGSMAGFSSATQLSTSPGFTYGSTGGNGYLQRCNFPNASITYVIVSPTYVTLPGQTTINFGFDLTGTEQADLVYVFMDYFDSNTGQFESRYISAATPQYTGSGGNQTATICMTVNMAAIPGFTPGNAYRLNIFLRNASASNAAGCIRFDNFRTTAAPSQVPLPVMFIDFTARKKANTVELIWNVAGEKEVSHYEVERSKDGSNFSKIGEVTAESKTAYSFIDKQIMTGVVYYRVRNVDLDGKFTYTKVVRVNLNKVVVLNAYPQPVRSELTIEHGAVSSGKITIASASGQIVKTVNVKTDALQTVIDVAGLQAGLYIVRFDNGQGGAETIKVVKQ